MGNIKELIADKPGLHERVNIGLEKELQRQKAAGKTLISDQDIDGLVDRIIKDELGQSWQQDYAKAPVKKETTTYFEVYNGFSWTGKWGKYSFETEQEAIDMATEFKANPRSHNEQMTDENVAYWKSKTYTVIKKTVTTQEVATI